MGVGKRIKAVNHSGAQARLSGQASDASLRLVCLCLYHLSVFPHSVGVCAQGLPEILSLATICHPQPCAPPRTSEL